jgi:hypothetical protein
MPVASSPNTSSADSDAEHLRSLGNLLNENIEFYLRSLSHSNLAAPNFRPGSGTSIPHDAAGITAYHAITTLAERIIGLTSGPAGLYGLSRQFFENAALQVAVELDLPAKVPLEGAVTAKKLAAETGAETIVVGSFTCRRCVCVRAGAETMIVRVLRALTPLFIFEETAPQTYRHTARSASLRDPKIKALVKFGYVPHPPSKSGCMLTAPQRKRVFPCRGRASRTAQRLRIQKRDRANRSRLLPRLRNRPRLFLVCIWPKAGAGKTLFGCNGGDRQALLRSRVSLSLPLSPLTLTNCP